MIGNWWIRLKIVRLRRNDWGRIWWIINRIHIWRNVMIILRNIPKWRSLSRRKLMVRLVLMIWWLSLSCCFRLRKLRSPTTPRVGFYLYSVNDSMASGRANQPPSTRGPEVSYLGYLVCETNCFPSKYCIEQFLW